MRKPFVALSLPSLLWYSIKLGTLGITKTSRAHEFFLPGEQTDTGSEHQAGSKKQTASASSVEPQPPLLVTAHEDGHLRLWTLEVVVLAGIPKGWDDKEESYTLQPSSTWHSIQTFPSCSRSWFFSLSLTTAKLYTRSILPLKALGHQNC